MTHKPKDDQDKDDDKEDLKSLYRSPKKLTPEEKKRMENDQKRLDKFKRFRYGVRLNKE